MKRISVVILAISLVCFALTGCGQTPAAPPAPAPAPTAPAPGASVPKKDMALRVNIGTEPQYTDPNRSTGIPDNTITLHCFEGLTRLKGSEVIPGVAESWEVKDDSTRYVFHLRPNAKWSNGDPVTARDFVFSWTRALEPATGSEYAYQLYYIKGALQFNSGETKTADMVGVKEIDAQTLEVTLEAPCPYFLYMTAFPTYYPLNERVVKADNEGWSSKPETYIGNGPFKMARWDHKSKVELTPNENYSDRGSVKLDRLVFTMIDDLSTELTMFETGELDVTVDVAEPEIPRVRKEKGEEWHPVPILGTYYYQFNVTRKPLNDIKVRKALTLAIDRKAVCEKILSNAGFTPATACVPPGLPDASAGGKDYREVARGYFPEYDPEAAKALLAEAGYPGGKGFPKIEILYNTSDRQKRIAEAVQAMWKANLNVDTTLNNQEWGVCMDSRSKLDYHVARSTWVADYFDPMTFVDMWTSNSGTNDTGWKSKKFDELVSRAKKSADDAERFNLMHQAEELVIGEYAICPIYYDAEPKMVNHNLKGAWFSPLSLHDYSRASIQ